jgi:hypothetical protein
VLKTTQWMVAILSLAAVPCVMAQSISADQQVNTLKPPPKMTAEEKKADKAAKRAPAAAQAPMKGPNAEIGKDQQVKTMTPPTKMTPEQKAADKAAKRKPPTAEEQAKQAKQSPGS